MRYVCVHFVYDCSQLDYKNTFSCNRHPQTEPKRAADSKSRQGVDVMGDGQMDQQNETEAVKDAESRL